MVRECICEYMAAKTIRTGPDEHGVPKVVKIGESLFFKRKYNWGRFKSDNDKLVVLKKDPKNVLFYL